MGLWFSGERKKCQPGTQLPGWENAEASDLFSAGAGVLLFLFIIFRGNALENICNGMNEKEQKTSGKYCSRYSFKSEITAQNMSSIATEAEMSVAFILFFILSI